MKINEVFKTGLGKTSGKITINPQTAKAIKRYCSDILHIYARTNNVLYRGSSNRRLDPLRMRPWPKRNPVDTTNQYHQDAIKNLIMLGATAHRGNSIFAISYYLDACKYGNITSIIFPVNGFHYTWSQKFRDFYTSLYNPNKETLFKNLKEWQKLYRYQIDTGLDEAINSAHEVMINGPYYAIPISERGKIGTYWKENMIEVMTWIKEVTGHYENQ